MCQVVDATLTDIRKQFFAKLEAFWDARTILPSMVYRTEWNGMERYYRAMLQVHQVQTDMSCCHTNVAAMESHANWTGEGCICGCAHSLGSYARQPDMYLAYANRHLQRVMDVEKYGA